jgi:acyl-CoA thioesterase-1
MTTMTRMTSARRLVLSVAALALLSACSLRNVSCGFPGTQTDGQASADQAAAPGASGGSTQASGTLIAFLGDSITAGLGLTSEQSYPTLVQNLFRAEGYSDVEVLNGGISGDTSAGGLRRVEQLLVPGVRILVVALGGNDALRGLSPAQTHENLSGIIETATGKGVATVLVGMEAPVNLGEDYRLAFREAFLQLVRDHKGRITYIPFLLEGVAGNPALNQLDGIHPNVAGAKVIADNLYPKLRMLVDGLPGAGR